MCARILLTSICPTVPSGVPTNITATATSPSSATLTWAPPPFEQQNGVITGYDVTISDMSYGDTHYLSTNQTYLNIDFLLPFRTYGFFIAALTEVGNGPFSTGETVINTPEAGMVKKLYLYIYHFNVNTIPFLLIHPVIV